MFQSDLRNTEPSPSFNLRACGCLYSAMGLGRFARWGPYSPLLSLCGSQDCRCFDRNTGPSCDNGEQCAKVYVSVLADVPGYHCVLVSMLMLPAFSD